MVCTVTRSLFFAAAALIATLPSVPFAFAQSVINVPPSPAPPSAGAGTTVNVLPGGALFNWFEALNGSSINLVGGNIPSMLLRSGSTMQMDSGQAGAIVTYAGSTIQVNGGLVSESLEGNLNAQIAGGQFERLWAGPGSTVKVAGGAFKQIIIDNGAEFELSGVDFFIDGTPVPGLQSPGDVASIAVPGGSTLTGVLANGTGFGYYNWDVTSAETFKISRSVAPPALPPGDVVVNAPSNLEFIGAGQTLKFQSGGQLPKHFRAAPGSRVEVTGGYLADGFHAIGAEVVVDGGKIGYDFHAFKDTNVTLKDGTIHESTFLFGSTLNVEGGEFVGTMRNGSTMNVYGGTVVRSYAREAAVNIHGGYIQDFSADVGTSVNVTGGQFQQFNMHHAAVDISGGTFNDDFFDIRIDAELTLNASEFRLNGALLTNLDNAGNSQTLTLGPQDVLSGVFDDGTPFIFSGYEGRIEEPVKLVRSAGYVPGPSLINVPPDAAPAGVHQGQTLILNDGGALPENFSALHGSSVKVQGGTVGHNFEVIGATVDATGGALATMDVFTGGVLNLGGTAQWNGLDVYAGGVANITGGLYGGGHFFRAYEGSELNISGGELRGVWYAENAEVNISGGTVDVYRQENVATSGSVVNLSGGYVQDLNLYDGAKLNATGGAIHWLLASNQTETRIANTSIERIQVSPGADMEITSGVVGEIDNVGGDLRIRGGALGDSHEWIDGVVEVYGYEFEVNGAPLAGLANVGDSVLFQYANGTAFSGSLEDGTPFMMGADEEQGMYTVGAIVRLIRTAAPTLPTVVEVNSDMAPYGAAPGQQVTVQPGGKLRDHFVAAKGSVVEIHGGSVGDNFEADRSDVLIAGGAVGEKMDVFKDAVVEVSGGSVGRHWEVHAGGELRLSGGLLDYQGTLRGGTLNVSGGSIAGSIDALDQSVVNVSGGEIGSELELQGGSQANVTGGKIGHNFRVGTTSTAHISGGQLQEVELQQTGRGEFTGGVVDNLTVASGAVANIRGGAFGDGFDSSSSAQVTLHGADFEINGVPVGGLMQAGDQVTLTVANNELFTGTLADGTPFAFDSREYDEPRTVTLTRAPLAAASPVVEVDSPSAPLGIRAGQQLNLRAGGQLGDSFNVGRGAELNVHDGVVGRNLEAFAATVNIHGGQIGADLDAFAGSTINVDGGSIGANFDLYGGATLNFNDGYAVDVGALHGSTVAMAGGKIRNLSLQGSTQIDWNGGVVDSFSFTFFSGASSSLDVFGVDFKLNGNPINGLGNVGDSIPFNPSPSDVLTGVLADGTPLVFRGFQSGVPSGAIRLNRSALPAPNLPVFQQVVDANAPFAIGAGQTLQLDGAGVLGQGFIAGPGSSLRIDDGLVNADLKAFGADLRIADGVVIGNVQFFENVDADIFGGTFEGNAPLIMSGSDVTLFGKQFFLNNVPISGLGAPGSSLVLNQRAGQMLKAILADGSTLQWRLQPFTPGGRGGPTAGISAGATLRIQTIPEPAAIGSVVILLAIGAPYLRRRSSM